MFGLRSVWVVFKRDHDFRTSVQEVAQTTAYKAGMRCSVLRECAEQAIALGRAVAIKTPHRDHAEKLIKDPHWQGD